MKQRQTRIPPQDRLLLKEALRRLVQLYEETNRPEEANKWKQELAEFEWAENK